MDSTFQQTLQTPWPCLCQLPKVWQQGCTEASAEGPSNPERSAILPPAPSDNGAPSAAMENPEVSWPPQGLPVPGDSLQGTPVLARGSPVPPDPLMHGAVSTSPIAGRSTKALPHSQPQPTAVHSSHHAKFLLLQSTAKVKQPSKHRHSYFSGVRGPGRHAEYWQRAAILARRRPPWRGREGHVPSLPSPKMAAGASGHP